MAVTDLILALYRDVRLVQPERFQAHAFKHLQTALPFDSGIWGSCHFNGHVPIVHSVFIHNQPLEMMIDFEQVKGEDLLALQILEQPGKTIARCIEEPEWGGTERVYEHAKRHHMHNIMATAQIGGGAGFIQAFSLYRHDQRHYFSEAERALNETLVPHLVESLTLSHCLHARAQSPSVETGVGLAAATVDGYLYDADAPFLKIMQLEWKSWTGFQLPQAALPLPGEFRRWAFRGRKVVLRSRPAGDVCHLRIYPLGQLNVLTPREHEVAECYMEQDYHGVAQALKLKPNAVRSYLQSVYGKLGVRSKTELLCLLATTGWVPSSPTAAQEAEVGATDCR